MNTNSKDLRKFGIVLAIVLLFWGLIFLYRHNAFIPYFFILSPVFLFLALAYPLGFRLIHTIFASLFKNISFLLTQIILCLVFFLVVTPLGLFMRMFKKDTLNEKIAKDTKSYWLKRDDGVWDKSQCEKQF